MDLPKWKKEQEEKRFKRHRRSIILFLSLVLTLVVLASGFRFYSGFRKSKIRGLHRVNFVIRNGEVTIVSIVGEREIVFVDLPEDKKIRLTRGYGDYHISAVFKLGELEKKGLKLLGESIQEYFAIPIEGVISLKKLPGCSLNGKNKLCLEKVLFSSLAGKAETDFSFFDLFLLGWRVRKTSDFSLRQLILEDLNQVRLDLLMERNFADEKISQENLTIGVFNSTTFPGLGNHGARIVTNIGGRVISVGNSNLRNNSLIKSSKKEANTYTVKLLEKIFQTKWEEGEIEGGRADIGIYLGEDYWKRLNEKW